MIYNQLLIDLVKKIIALLVDLRRENYDTDNLCIKVRKHQENIVNEMRKMSMAQKKTSAQISYNMSRVKNKNTTIEVMLAEELNRRGISTFTRNPSDVPGKPDIVFEARRIAVFCDGDFWHGYNWKKTKREIHSNRAFWINKIEKNMVRDKKVNDTLISQGWMVFRFWGHEIKKDLSRCADVIEKALRKLPRKPYRTIDLCAGIGGIRRGFELTGCFKNVMSAEVDQYACRTYKHLFGDGPLYDLTSDEFNTVVSNQKYDVLLAGFPCQTFSRVGKEKGFEDESKGRIFFHIAKIIRRTRPMAFFLENVDRLVTHDGGNTFNVIIDTLINSLGYHVIGVSHSDKGDLTFNPRDFVRNSRDFGVPQNRPRTYIIGFDTERFPLKKLNNLPISLPKKGKQVLYHDLNDVLESNVEAKYYMASGYLETLIKHRERQENKGYGFGYRIVNDPSIKKPIANTLLATGGSGKERNLILDPRKGIAGIKVPGKKTPLNDKGIRVMTPTEWGRLQGFINYAFIDRNGNDTFSFPDDMPDSQKYKQFGNSVTIPVIKEMADFILECIEQLRH